MIAAQDMKPARSVGAGILAAAVMIVALTCAVALPGLIAICEWQVTAKHGSLTWQSLATVLMIPCGLTAMAAALSIPLCCGLFFVRKARPVALACIVLATVHVSATCLAMGSIKRVRMKAFEGLASRSEPLIDAIRAYETKFGRPPRSLKDLVPQFMDRISQTGMAAYPDYEYETPADYGNAWMLCVSTPSGGINFDQFIYLPRQNYPEEGFGGHLERIGDWAYVHE